MNNRWLSILLVASMLGAGCLAEEVPAELPSPTAQEQPAADAQEPEAPQMTEAPQDTEVPQDTETPQDTEVPQDTETPVETASPDPSASPDCSASPEPDVSPTATPAVEGYLLDAQGAKLQGGALAELLQTEGALRVCVSTRELVLLKDFPLYRLREIEFTPDLEQVSDRFRVVLSASERMEDEFTLEAIEAMPEDAVGDLYVWLWEEPSQPTPPPSSELRLDVSAEDYYDDRWSCVPPTFTLSGIGEGDVDCAYAAIILDERIAILSDDTYLPLDEGVYSVRFAIMDAMGDIADRSDKYNLRLDFTPPDLGIEVSLEADRTMTLHLSDAMSGVESLSLDGGASWIVLDGAEVYPYTASEKQTFAPGSILLRDVAGNIASNAEEIVLDKLPSMSMGGGGGDGSSTPKKQHASGDGDTAQYNAYQLELPEDAVETLTLGGEETDLRLEIANAEGETDPGTFRARLLRWARETSATPEEGGADDPDTLVLTAEPAPAEADDCDRVWRINGAVLRKLYNSDIRYLLLDVDGAMLSLPTQGFTAGTRYAELKMQGVSTAEFNYEIHMRSTSPDGDAATTPAYNRAPGCASEIWVEVAGERFELMDRDSTPEMYPCDVYCAPDDLPDYPYGAYPAFADGAETEA